MAVVKPPFCQFSIRVSLSDRYQSKKNNCHQIQQKCNDIKQVITAAALQNPIFCSNVLLFLLKNLLKIPMSISSILFFVSLPSSHDVDPDSSASPISVQSFSATSFLHLSAFIVQLEPLTDEHHSRLFRVAVLSSGFLGGLQEILQRVVLRDAEKIVSMGLP